VRLKSAWKIPRGYKEGKRKNVIRETLIQSWELGAGSWELGAGSWELGAGSWELGAGERFDGSLRRTSKSHKMSRRIRICDIA